MPPVTQVTLADIPQDLLECVINVSEGRDRALLEDLRRSCEPHLVDLHVDAGHHRSVFSLAGPAPSLQESARRLAAEVVRCVDLTAHAGAHPRFGALDVVPFAPLEGWPFTEGSRLDRAVRARDELACRLAGDLGLPVFLYGPARSLPEIRHGAWSSLMPDKGPQRPHPTAGSAAVGARPVLVAYNLWLVGRDLSRARAIAAQLRSPEVRALAFSLPSGVQVSCNLIRPFVVGPADVYDKVRLLTEIERAELVGLLPQRVLAAVPEERWPELDLAADRTIEARLTPRLGTWLPAAATDFKQ